MYWYLAPESWKDWAGAMPHRHSGSLERIPTREDTQQLPEPAMPVADGVRTVGELEVIEHLSRGCPSWMHGLRTNTPGDHSRRRQHAPPEAAESLDEWGPGQPTVFFSNGPQCAQSPWAIRAALEGGYPKEGILYYRGGMHDWLTLGLPAIPGSQEQEAP